MSDEAMDRGRTLIAEHAKTAAAALRDCGIEPVYVRTGGGSDASIFESRGLRCLNVADGTEDNHSVNERVGVEALETMLDVALRLLGRAAEQPC